MRLMLQQLLTSYSVQGLSTEPPLPVEGIGVHQGESMLTSQITKPFIVYTIGNSTSENLAEEDYRPERQFFQVYVHDKPADYSRIDDIVKAIKDTLVGQRSLEHSVMIIRHLETSRDLDDSTMKTIMRYIRFQAIKEK